MPRKSCPFISSFQESSFPLTSGWKTRDSGGNHFELPKETFCPSGFTAQSASIAHASNGCYQRLSFSDRWSRGTKTLGTRLNVDRISGPKRSIKITDHFTCTSANIIYCITCTLCKKLYIGETERRLGDRFREHLRDGEKDDQNASTPVARHFNLPNHSKQHMAVCGPSLHQGSTESRKTLEQKIYFSNRHS